MNTFNEILKNSTLILKLSKFKSNEKSRLFGNNVRHLTSEEITRLQQNNCYATDWDQILVTEDFQAERLRQVTFQGKVILGGFTTGDKSNELGIYNCLLKNCEVGKDCLLQNVSTIENALIEDQVVIVDTGEISADQETTFGNGVKVSIGVEIGGRDVNISAEVNFQQIADLLTNRSDSETLQQYEDFLQKYLAAIKSSYTVISRNSQIKYANYIRNSYLGESTQIDSIIGVKNSTLLSSNEEVTCVTDGSLVVDSILQWGCKVSDMALVNSSLLCEHSHVERHGKVTQSIVGPNTGVGEGECTASLLGPFVGFHHQSLVIGTVWPEGKGNVGYGANVGSNHTAKAPDQELFPGEGLFFGLGCNIKFPADYTRSPYTIIATGVTTLPQKVEFPFSLINTPAANYSGISPAFNEIFPGWVLKNNIYMIKRNEQKYMQRNKARRSEFIFEVFRPEIIDMMITAKERLQQVSGKEIYLSSDIPGLGKNYLLEKNRLAGIEAYDFYLKYYALKGLFQRLEKGFNRIEEIWQDEDNPRWNHEKQILQKVFQETDPLSLLEEFKKFLLQIAEDVEKSKEKDDRRGEKIIADYALVHQKASQDSFVKSNYTATRQLITRIEQITKKIKGV